MSVAKKASGKSFQQAWTESFGVIENKRNALCVFVLKVLEALLICISFKTKNDNAHVVFSNLWFLNWGPRPPRGPRSGSPGVKSRGLY